MKMNKNHIKLLFKTSVPGVDEGINFYANPV